MTDTEITRALQELSGSELTVMIRKWADTANDLTAYRQRIAHVYHMLTVAAAEEQDRRTSVLDALDPDDEPGALVTDVAAVIEEAKAELRGEPS